MDLETAAQAFDGLLWRKEREHGIPLAPCASPERLSCGWAFYYQSRGWVETQELQFALVGHGPVVIRDDGVIMEGSALDRDPEALLAR